MIPLVGGAVLLVSLAWVAWTLWSGYPPSFSRLTPMSGEVKSIAFGDGTRGRRMDMTIEEHGRLQRLVLEHIERLPVLEWPLESVHSGDRVVAWAAASRELAADEQKIWQLQIRRHRVVDYGNLATAQHAELVPACVYGGIGTAIGAVLVATAVLRRRRAT